MNSEAHLKSMHQTDTESGIINHDENIKVHIVCYEGLDDWILGKFARKLLDELEKKGVTCSVSKRPDPTADINHHICYTLYGGVKNAVHTVMVTHVNTAQKFELLRRQMPAIEMGICLSRETMEMLALRGFSRSKLCFINPAHDGTVEPRKIVIGITHRIYPDGRKGEQVLLDLAGNISPNDFKFRIMGSGWEVVVAELSSLGFQVELTTNFERQAYESLFSSIDYYLYFAMDEGSMGFVDAAAAGVPTIVSAQGFHLDAKDAVTFSFDNKQELEQIFENLATEKRNRQAAVQDWTWPSYARKHLLLWNYILARRANRKIVEPLVSQLREIGVAQSSEVS